MLFLHIFLESNSNSNATICVIFNHSANYGLLFKNKTSEEKSKILIISVKLIFSHFHISLCPSRPKTLMNQALSVCVFLGGHHDWCCIYYYSLSSCFLSCKLQFAWRHVIIFLFYSLSKKTSIAFWSFWWDLLKQNCYLSNWHFPIDWHLVKTMDHYGQFWWNSLR